MNKYLRYENLKDLKKAQEQVEARLATMRFASKMRTRTQGRHKCKQSRHVG